MKINNTNENLRYFEKLREIVLDIVNRDENQEKIIRFRKEIGIPTQGILLDDSKKPLQDYSESEKWKYWRSFDTYLEIDNLAAIILSQSNIDWLKGDKTNLIDYRNCNNLVVDYIIRGKILLNNFLNETSDIILGITKQKTNPSTEEIIRADIFERKFLSFQKNIKITPVRVAYDYPISINLRPDTSIRDIVIFIKNNSGLINMYQKEFLKGNSSYKILANRRVRTKKERKINDFIYKNRKSIVYKKGKLNTDDLYDLIENKFGTKMADKYAGYDNILSVIGLERKRRKS